MFTEVIIKGIKKLPMATAKNIAYLFDVSLIVITSFLMSINQNDLSTGIIWLHSKIAAGCSRQKGQDQIRGT
ncbi:MAG: hypothetical protein AVO34_00850 [Firmicutes bacterium ML8_F2]|nr:MAG: hypothetical protein AVO34_00850 [Firmicutes bacterium ML8_F2]